MSSAIAPLMNKLVAEATTRSDPTVGDLIEEITDLLGRSVIQEHAEACQILRTRLTHLSGESDSDQLTVQQQRFYNICPYLINRQGGYNSACLKLLKTIKKNTKVSVPKIAFGKAEWKKYFGDVGAEPPLPANLNKILYSPCPFWPGRKVLETHLLTLIPSHINKENLAIK